MRKLFAVHAKFDNRILVQTIVFNLIDAFIIKLNTGRDAIGLTGLVRPQYKAACNGSTVPKCNPEVAAHHYPHYRDPVSLVHLQKWSTSGYFPADMRIWASREADSLLLNNQIKPNHEHVKKRECFHKYDGWWPENISSDSKDDNKVESVIICREIPSSTIKA
ncbi:hypothetical protein L1987_74520 [Smallanthus sonchifolius]|uniref:Uncharacterized protein n=1 Tax=Smallanthus sonchifolius TaxID=185202 RepID=A0ACB9A3S9_9ASTR|nr:hypothetical protein L1987_74520 [Smallanthus sonchifolius]